MEYVEKLELLEASVIDRHVLYSAAYIKIGFGWWNVSEGLNLIEFLESETEVLTDQLSVLTWPYPNSLRNDDVIEYFSSDSRIDEIHTTVGRGEEGSLRLFHDSPGINCLDVIMEEPVLSYDVPELIEEGKVDVDLEYARDVAMDFVYNHNDGSDEDVAERIVQNSVSLDDDISVVYDLHDFGHPGLYTTEDKRSSSHEMFREVVDRYFGRTEYVQSDGYNSGPYIFAEDPSV